jgi:energy-coupling factor transporter ATP-binding protein EcfA2
MDGPAISARALNKRCGQFEAVKGIDFDVRARECFGFLGPNGAGKTTTMRMISCTPPRPPAANWKCSGCGRGSTGDGSSAAWEWYPRRTTWTKRSASSRTWSSTRDTSTSQLLCRGLTGDAGAALASALWIAAVTAAVFVAPLNLLRRRLVK